MECKTLAVTCTIWAAGSCAGNVPVSIVHQLDYSRLPWRSCGLASRQIPLVTSRITQGGTPEGCESLSLLLRDRDSLASVTSVDQFRVICGTSDIVHSWHGGYRDEPPTCRHMLITAQRFRQSVYLVVFSSRSHCIKTPAMEKCCGFSGRELSRLWREGGRATHRIPSGYGTIIGNQR